MEHDNPEFEEAFGIYVGPATHDEVVAALRDGTRTRAGPSEPVPVVYIDHLPEPVARTGRSSVPNRFSPVLGTVVALALDVLPRLQEGSQLSPRRLLDVQLPHDLVA